MKRKSSSHNKFDLVANYTMSCFDFISELLLRRINIGFRLIIFFLILSIIPLGILGSVAVSQANKALSENISIYSLQLINQIILNQQNSKSNIEDLATEIILSQEYKDYTAASQNSVELSDMLVVSKRISALINTRGSIQEGVVGIGLYDPGKETFVHGLFREDQVVIYKSSEFKQSLNGMMGKWILTPGNELVYIKGGANSSSLMVSITLKKDYYNRLYKEQSQLEGRYYILLDGDNKVIASASEDMLGKYLDSIIPISKELASGVAGGAKTGVFWEDQNRTRLMVTYGSFDKSDWKLVNVVPFSQLMEHMYIFTRIVVSIVLLCLVFSILISIGVTRSVTVPVRQIAQMINRMKMGDFSLKMDIKFKDEISRLAMDINGMIDEVSNTIKDVNDSTRRVVQSSNILSESSDQAEKAAEQIAKAVEEMAEGASLQAAEAKVGMNAIGSLDKNLNEISENILLVQQYTENTKQLSESSMSVILDLSEKALKTGDVTGSIILRIEELSKELKQIDGIIKLIVSIADQTNLLSLNAAIEAARAAEAGRGFAVVAEEVRHLAEQSKKASTDISNIIKSIQKKNESVIEVASSATQTIEQQMKAVELTSHAFDSIVKSTGMISDQTRRVNELVASMEELKQTTVKTMERIACVTENAAASTEQISASTEEQIATAEQMLELADKLKEMASTLDKTTKKFTV